MPIAYVVPINFVTELPASLPNMNISDVGFFKGNLRSQTFFEVPTDCYCTSANTTWRTASLNKIMQNLRQLFLLDTNITLI